MKTAFLVFIAALTLSANAERVMSIGAFSREMRAKIVGKLTEALQADDEPALIDGVVTAIGEKSFFLQCGNEGMKVLFAVLSEAGVNPGRRVRAIGSPMLEGGRVVFAAQFVKNVGLGERPTPVPVGAAELVYAGEDGRGVNWLLVEVCGRAISRTEKGFAMSVEGVPVTVVVDDLPSFMADCADTHPQVRVVGVAELVLDQSTLLGGSHYVMGVRLNVAKATDLALVPDASYLLAKHRRTITSISVVIAFVLGVGILAFVAIVFCQRRRLFRTRTIMAERKRMADDIHDTIEQHLVGAGMLLRLNRTKEAQDVLVRAKRELRDVVWGLKNDDMMRLSPMEVLRNLAHDETTRGICRVEVVGSGLPDQMDSSQMRDLVLIVREAIGNAIKHGHARKVAMSVDPVQGDGWKLRIANDGALFDPASVPSAGEGHFGIEGMRQRARRIGAELSFEVSGLWMVVTIKKRGLG